MTNTTPPTRSFEWRDHRGLRGPLLQFIAERKTNVSELAKKVGYDRSVVNDAIHGRPITWTLGHEIAVALGVRDDAVMEKLPDPDREQVAG